MLYDAQSESFKISIKEFVAIARRGIAPSVPYDEDEPYAAEIGKYEKRALGISESEELRHTFSLASESFSLFGRATVSEEGNITVVKSKDGMGKAPSRELKAQSRGEGFVAAYILGLRDERDCRTLEVIYIDQATGERVEVTEQVSRACAERFFNKCLRAVSLYSKPELERVKYRLPSMCGAKFPYSNVREGQREFISRAYRTICRGGSFLALAPTGTGKTVSALFPAVRAMGEGHGVKTFYLTPKTTTARAAQECVELMCRHGVLLRAVSITSKERSCKNGLRCRDSKDACENSKCNRLTEAALELYELGLPVITSREVETVSRKYTVCPYELELSYAELCDVVICDINYLFDPRSYIRRFFTEGGDYIFLIDEAHNLPERARELFSAKISADEVCEPHFSELLGEYSQVKKASLEAGEALRSLLFPYLKDEIRALQNGDKVAAVHMSDIPDALYGIFRELLSVTEDEISLNIRAKDEERDGRLKLLRAYYYKIKRVYEAALRFDGSYRLFLFLENDSIRLKLFCIDTGSAISECISKGRSAVFFSATLAPIDYYRAMLGLDRTADIIEVDSPFAPEQLEVAVIDKISTRLSEREDTLLAVCRAIAATVSARRGNYIVFAPSFAYSEALARIFSSKYPKIKTLLQTKNMSASQKAEFLSAFEEKNGSYLIAFCVMGGVFAEGIDLAGDSLIGAVIVGTGLPQLSYEREAIAEYFEDKYESGKEFAYIYPGINRVLQAAGRVIRTEEDRGIVVLIDDRFDDPIYKKSLPRLWGGVKFIPDAKELKGELEKFWREAADTPQ